MGLFARAFDFLCGDDEREELHQYRKSVPFEWWEYADASTQVLPLVVGPYIPPDDRTDEQKIEDAAWESYARMVENGEITG